MKETLQTTCYWWSPSPHLWPMTWEQPDVSQHTDRGWGLEHSVWDGVIKGYPRTGAFIYEQSMPLSHTCPASGWGSHAITAEPQRASSEKAHGQCTMQARAMPPADVIPAHRSLALAASKIQRVALGCGVWNWCQPLPCETYSLVGRQLIYRQTNQMISTVISVIRLCRKETINPGKGEYATPRSCLT